MTEQVKFPQPLHRGVIVKRVKLDIESKIILPDSAKSPQNEGILMAKGDECLQKMKIGSRVLFNKLANQYLIHEGETYHIMSENDVYAEIKKDDEGTEYPEPYNKWLFVLSNKGEIKLNTGVFILEGQKVANFGMVVGAGSECKWVKKGNRVLYSYYVDHEVMFKGKTFMFMSEVDVQAIIPQTDIVGAEDHGGRRRTDVPLSELPEIEKKEEFKGTITHEIKKS